MSESDAQWALGFMSGTSLDGVDAALIRTDGVDIFEFGPGAYHRYQDRQQRALRDALRRAAQLTPHEAAEKSLWAREARLLADAHLACVEELGEDAPQAEIAGFHGQTILHRPDVRVTVQIGDAEALAEGLGVPVVHDFRSADVAAGGQGAPFAPFYHLALARHAGLTEPCAFLNMGGVGNVTFVDPTAPAPEAEGALLAFDTGPANAPIDDFVRSRSGARFDENGALAAFGMADEALIGQWVASASYLQEPAPKSLDRNDFASIAEDLGGHSEHDGAATLAGFAAACVSEARKLAPRPPSRWFVCGGGRHNPALMKALSDRLGAVVEPVEAIGVDGDFVEAQAFAYLAVRSSRGLPLSAPGTTGCPSPTLGGVLVEA